LAPNTGDGAQSSQQGGRTHYNYIPIKCLLED
jgi:hypothetical protein